MRALEWLACVGGLVALSSCASVISERVSQEATPIEAFREVREAPDRFKGKTVILGGEIIETRNRASGTILLVLEKPLDALEKPRSSDVTGGRFMTKFSDYLDPVLFAPGRKVTVAGVVAGVETEKVGEAPYPYVLLEGREVHLWQETGNSSYVPWSAREPLYPWWYDPYWGRRPWW